jgi:hypothetical protein
VIFPVPSAAGAASHKKTEPKAAGCVMPGKAVEIMRCRVFLSAKTAFITGSGDKFLTRERLPRSIRGDLVTIPR